MPRAVGLVVAAVFGLTAARLLQMRSKPPSGGDGFAALILGGLAAIGGWIAFWPGVRVCASGLDGQQLIAVDGLGCRIPFGIGGIIAVAMAAYAGRRWLRASRP